MNHAVIQKENDNYYIALASSSIQNTITLSKALEIFKKSPKNKIQEPQLQIITSNQASKILNSIGSQALFDVLNDQSQEMQGLKTLLVSLANHANPETSTTDKQVLNLIESLQVATAPKHIRDKAFENLDQDPESSTRYQTQYRANMRDFFDEFNHDSDAESANDEFNLFMKNIREINKNPPSILSIDIEKTIAEAKTNNADQHITGLFEKSFNEARIAINSDPILH